MKKIILSIFVLSILLPTFAFASFDTSLKYGSRGDAVIELQDLLVAQGFLKGNVDGRYGLVTLNAVKAFQTANGLSPDGYFGIASQAKASSILVNQLQSSNTAEQTETGAITHIIVAGCTATSAYSSTTGILCSMTATLPAGCTSSLGFSPTTGASCATGVGSTLPAGCISISGFSITTGQACNNIITSIQQIQQNTQQIAQNTTPPAPTAPIKAPENKSLCNEDRWFIPLEGTHENSPELPDDGHLYEFTIKVFGETYKVSLHKEDEITIFDNTKGVLFVSGSSNSFQVSLGKFIENSTDLEIAYPSDTLKPSGKTNSKCYTVSGNANQAEA
jgi:hypothetical protein